MAVAAKADRLKVIGGHLRDIPEIRTRAFPAQRHTVLKWNGWGYNNCSFRLNDQGIVVFRGGRCVVFVCFCFWFLFGWPAGRSLRMSNYPIQLRIERVGNAAPSPLDGGGLQDEHG